MMYATVLYADGDRELLEVFDNEEEAKRDARAYLKRWCSDDPDMQIVCFSTNTDPDAIEDFADLKGKELWAMTCNDVTASKKVRKFSVKASNKSAKRRAIKASMSTGELYRALKDLFRGMDDENKVTAWNGYCAKLPGKHYYDFIYFMRDELDEEFRNWKPPQFATLLWSGRGFDPHDNFFRTDWENEISSFNGLNDDESPYDEDAVIEYIVNNEDDFMMESISDILEDYIDYEDED